MNEQRISLSALAPGEVGVVRQLAGGRGFVSRLATLGFTLGVASPSAPAAPWPRPVPSVGQRECGR